jgi:hypothetical protein
MQKVILYDWKPGFNKAGLNKLLRAEANYSLSAAIEAVGKLLEKETLEIEFASSESANAFLTEALNLGAVGKSTTTTTVTLNIPDTILNDLKRVAPVFGFSNYQPLIQHYVDIGLRVDLERLKMPTIQSLINNLKRHGVDDTIIAQAVTESYHQ